MKPRYANVRIKLETRRAYDELMIDVTLLTNRLLQEYGLSYGYFPYAKQRYVDLTFCLRRKYLRRDEEAVVLAFVRGWLSGRARYQDASATVILLEEN